MHWLVHEKLMEGIFPSLRKRVQTDSGAQSASLPIRIVDSCSGNMVVAAWRRSLTSV